MGSGFISRSDDVPDPVCKAAPRPTGDGQPYLDTRPTEDGQPYPLPRGRDQRPCWSAADRGRSALPKHRGRPGTVSPTSTPHKRTNSILKRLLRGHFPLGKPTPKRPPRVSHFDLLICSGLPWRGSGLFPRPRPRLRGTMDPIASLRSNIRKLGLEIARL
jgi:hypothetical protein